MKKGIAFIILILAIIGVWWYISQQNQNSATVVNLHPVTENHPDPENATFTFDNNPVTLHNGEAQVSVGSISEDTQLTDVIGYGDLNGDGEEDAAAIIAQSGGGSGTFIYVAAYVSGPVQYKGTNAIFIGDRIDPQSVSIKGKVITVNYLDRKPEEPLAADPTVPTTKTFTYDPVTQSIE